MNIKNSVQLIGNIGTDIQVTTFDNGNKKASFSLATNEYYTNNKGEKTKSTEWHNVVVWGKMVDFISTSTKKGAEIAIQGKLSSRSYTDKEGNTRYITEVVLNEFYAITRERQSQN